MEQELISPPRTIMEVYKMLPEGTLTDLIDGRLYVWPVPFTAHARMKGKLLIELANFIKENPLGEILPGPLDIYLDETNNVVQSDILFISNENPSQLGEEDPYQGTPDLLVEILSHHNPEHDLVTKKKIYEKFGVKEYWIIDPVTKESIVYQLVENRYVLSKKDKDQLFSPLFNHSFTI